jgi:DNA polymerase III delta subunit
MEEEFYHKDLFGTVVDVSPSVVDEDNKLPLDKKGREFNIFAFTDALGARKKKDAWVLYQKALAAGLSAEEVFWKMVWQVKTLLLAKKTSNAEEAGMKDYPYSKAKGYLKNFKEGELEQLSETLVVGYHQTRRGGPETETFLEKTILGL